MWDLVGASPAGPISNGQPDVEVLEAGIIGERLSAAPEPGYFLACHCYASNTRKTKEKTPGNRRW
jgi:hypothetical protein